MPRTRTGAPVIFICIAVLAFAAFLPGICSLDWAILSPQWVVLPDCSVVDIRPATEPCGEQPVALLSFALSRAPPTA